MSRERRPRLFDGLFAVGFVLLTIWMSWSVFRTNAPEGGVSDYLLGLSPGMGWAAAALAVLAVVFAVDARLRRMGLEGSRRLRPAMIAGLGVAVVTTAVLIWMQSGWAVAAISFAIFMAVQTARAAGLEPSDDPSTPHNQERSR